MECRIRDVLIERSKCVDLSAKFSVLKSVVFMDCDLEGANFLGAKMENVLFMNCNLNNSQFSQTKLKNVSFKGSSIQGISIDKESFGGITVNTGQALYLVSVLGLKIED